MATHGRKLGWILGLGMTLGLGILFVPRSEGADGSTEALELRLRAEQAIAQERSTGRPQMADAMEQALPDLLQEYLATRDGTIALDAVDAAFVQEQFKIARALEEPGVALALDVFSGPGTGYENELRTGIAHLADFHSDHAERVSEKTLDVQERAMERQLDKIERKADSMTERLETKGEAKLEARLDAVAERMEKKETKALHRAEQAAEKTEQKQEKLEQKQEKQEEKLEKRQEKQEEKQEKQQEKQEQKQEKQEEKLEKQQEKQEQKQEKQEQKQEKQEEKKQEKSEKRQ